MPEVDPVVSDPEKVVSDNNPDQTPPENKEPSKDVSYDTHRKLLGQKKTLQDKFTTMEQELTSLREKSLGDEGKKDELIDSLRGRLSETEGKLKNAVGTFGYKTVSSEFKTEALKMGCVETDLAMMSIQEELKTLDIDDDFNVDRSQVKSILENLKKSKPILFQKSVPNIPDGGGGAPENKGVPPGYLTELEKCTTQRELDAVRKKHGRF